jgi:hypothetical protein
MVMKDDSVELILKGALEGGLAGFVVSYIIPALASQSESSEEKSRPIYVGAGAFLGALRRVLAEKDGGISRSTGPRDVGRLS